MIDFLCYITIAGGTTDLSQMCGKQSNVEYVQYNNDNQAVFVYLYRELANNYSIANTLLYKLEQHQDEVILDAKQACSGSTPTLRERFYKERTFDIMRRYSGERRKFELVYNHIVYLAATRSMC